ncbi:MAG TPA: GTP 3',8-cyclase MoaA [Candidatus Polarisedimenticolia bacterium]|nr:GTP 3',8-cyclase MoaA [Candidatus Polarisedimenticolia bacterium]
MLTPLSGPAAGADALTDRFGRVARSLRLSVTDRCNLRCLYCMPDGAIPWFERRRILTFEEIRRIVAVLAGLGVSEVRLTGGEPLLRQDLPDLARMITQVEGVQDLAVTTNGLRLRSLAAPLVEAGVRRFNVHLDGLDPDTYSRASRRDGLGEVLSGLEELERLGAVPIKVNVVLMRGINDHAILDFAELARRRPYQVRFIELMPLGGGEAFEIERLVPGGEVRRRIEAVHPLEPLGRDRPAAPARVFRFADGVGDIGFINPVSEPFCSGCDRIRLTADGMLRNCLFARSETNVKAILRAGGTDREIAAAVRANVAGKGPGGCVDLAPFYQDRLSRKMWQIGG